MRKFESFNVHLTINQSLILELHNKFSTVKYAYR